MDQPGLTKDAGRPARASERVDAACDRFEAAWRAGAGPRIEDYLDRADADDRPALLRELVALERELRRRGGQRPALEEYLRRFPAHAEAVRVAFGAPPAQADRPPRDAGRDLLFGLLALQNDFVSRDDLLAAFAAWVAEKSRPLDRILLDCGALDEARRALIEALAAEHLRRHGGDTEASLAAVSSLGPLRGELERLGDPDLQVSLAATTARAVRSRGDANETRDLTLSSRRAGSRFRLLRFHREGGLGRVFLARDDELGREVALKEIRPDKADAADLRARFVLEAEVTGGLEHPGIVPVYSLGSYDDGRPFYAMRFVEGDSLMEAIEAYHGAQPRPDLGGVEFRRLLGRFVDVCEAIAFAHGRGVLHRDIKPGNVIVGRHGETLVVDWGLAKATGQAEPGSGERTLVPGSASGSAETLPGSALGTPAYMSPEQAAGDLEALGPRSDVYSLGATLYCLLTGRPPFEGEPGEVLGAVGRGEFRRPRQIDPAIDPALEAVCLKAMALHPEDRYASCRALAEDVERWLADDPVSAWREPVSRRAGRWARLHRTAVTAAIVALATGVVGLGAVTAVQAHLNAALRKANDATNQALADTRAAKRTADEALAETRKAQAETQAALAQSEAVSRFLVSALRSPDPTQDGRQIRVADLLDRSSELLDKEFTGSPPTKGALLEALGRTYDGLGLYDRAISLHIKARAAREAALGPDHPDTLKSLNHLANAYFDADRLSEAIPLYEATLKLREAKLGPDHPDTFWSRNNLANAYMFAGRMSEAIALYEATLKLREITLGVDHLDTLSSRRGLAIAYDEAGRMSEAIALHEANLKFYDARLGPDHFLTISNRSNLATTFRDAGRLSEAIALFEAIVKLLEAKLNADHPETLLNSSNLAEAYLLAGRVSEGLALSQATLTLREAILGPHHRGTLVTRKNVAAAYEALGRLRDAEKMHRETLARRRKTVPPGSPLLADDLHLLARNLALQSRCSEAEPIWLECMAIRRKATPDDWRLYDTMSRLGGALLDQGRYADAEPLIVPGYEGMKAREARMFVPDRPGLLEAAVRVIRLYEARGKPDQVVVWKRRLGLADLPADVFARP
jgi:serine/threonine-protein kinase